MEQPNNQTQRSEQDRHSLNDRTGDLKDSKRDEERLKPDEAIIDLPDVKDIPGQEHIHPPALGELADTTISSADEEGEGLFDDTDNDSYSLNKGDTSQNDNSTQGNP
jgi:hypothetical protein